MSSVTRNYIANLSLFLVLILTFFWGHPVSSSEELIFTFSFFIYLALAAAVLKALTLSGALAAAIMGTHFMAVSGLSLWPLVWFFVTGSLWSRLPSGKATPIPHKPRNATQVLSNGAVAVVCSFLYSLKPGGATELCYLASVAIACSDTWSSELGNRMGKTTYDLRSFKPLNPGVSGGVSLAGTAAGLAGALLIASFASDWNSFFIITAAGMAGNICDSTAGAFLQARYTGQDGAMSDLGSGKPASGYRWMNNDGVNLLSNAVTTGLLALIL